MITKKNGRRKRNELAQGNRDRIKSKVKNYCIYENSFFIKLKVTTKKSTTETHNIKKGKQEKLIEYHQTKRTEKYKGKETMGA